MSFDPVSIGLFIAGQALSAIGNIQQGKAAQAAANPQARRREQEAALLRAKGAVDQQNKRIANKRLFGKRLAALGGSGIDPKTGTPLLVDNDVFTEAELAVANIGFNAEVGAIKAENEAGILRAQGAQAKRQSFFRAGANILQGIGGAFALNDALGKTGNASRLPGGSGFGTTGIGLGRRERLGRI